MKNTNLERTFVGVDCHKNSIACFVNNKFKEFKTDFKEFKKALEWVKNQNLNSVWAIEGAYSYGLSFSKFLLESGCEVFEFNALATAKARKALSISGTKNDMGDAKVISIFAKHFDLQEVSLKTIELKKKITTRKLFVKQRTELINNIKSHCIKSGIIIPFKSLTTLKAISRLKHRDDVILQVMAANLEVQLNSIKILEEEIKKNTPKQIEKLRELTGIGTLTASIIYTETKGKKMTKAQFASYCGVAPVECSGGLTTNYRNNKRGNRTLNSLLYSISILQSGFDDAGTAYFQKKISEGKTKRHARKCLARQLCNQIWKLLYSE